MVTVPSTPVADSKVRLYDSGELFDMIERRFRSPEWVVLPGVSNATGSGIQRRCDALAMNLWPSRGLEIHGFEIKVSRGDFLRELKDPEKAEKIAKYCDRWWLVVAAPDIVREGELPPTWGLLVARGESLRLKMDAPKLSPVEMSRSFLAAMLRTAITSSGNARKLAAEKKLSREEGYEAGRQDHDYYVKNLKAEAESANEKLDKLTKALGLRSNEISWQPEEKIAAAFRFAMGFAMHNRDGFARLRTHAENIIASCDKALGMVEAGLEEESSTERTDV